MPVKVSNSAINLGKDDCRERFELRLVKLGGLLMETEANNLKELLSFSGEVKGWVLPRGNIYMLILKKTYSGCQ